MVTGIGMGIFASMLLFGMRAKAATVRDGVNTPIFSELVTMDRNEREDMRNAEPVLADEDGAEDVAVGYSASDLDLLAAIVYAEAGDQDFTGQRLVADVVLNRVHSPAWPNSVSEVIYQPYQFSPVLDGGLGRAWGNVTESCYEAARLALQGDHINTEVIYFSMYGCSNGIFAFQHGCHCFGY
jgi:N-acetylmuramoyl-L-alanine amidase